MPQYVRVDFLLETRALRRFVTRVPDHFAVDGMIGCVVSAAWKETAAA